MYTTPWSKEEEAVLIEHYPSHGETWEGYVELLPSRTQRAIGKKARDLGLKVAEPQHGSGRKKGGSYYRNRPYVDPCEAKILSLMREGKSPSQIDAMMHWWSGKTVKILTGRWARERE